jgi:phosphate transport system protein
MAIARVEYQHSLDALEEMFQGTGEIVLRSIAGAVDALRTQDVELCDEVIAFDDEVDSRYLWIEKQVELVLARHTPVATDLRLVLAILHSTLHLERVGDQCVTIAKLTKLSSHLDTKRGVVDSLCDMGERCAEMVDISLAAFAARDVTAARGLNELDDLVDRANRQVFQQVLGYVHDAEALEWGMRQMTAARCFERIGDNAVDIGEQIAFLVSGEFREFTDASHTDTEEGGL